MFSFSREKPWRMRWTWSWRATTLSNSGNAVLPTTVTGQATTPNINESATWEAQDLTDLAITIDGANVVRFRDLAAARLSRNKRQHDDVHGAIPANEWREQRSLGRISPNEQCRCALYGFAINISGQALSFTSSTGGDGISDAASSSTLHWDSMEPKRASAGDGLLRERLYCGAIHHGTIPIDEREHAVDPAGFCGLVSLR